MESKVVISTSLPGIQLFKRGKVRDIYLLNKEYLLIIATDRISAFDVVLPNGIPDKGKILTRLSCHWFRIMEDIIANHVVSHRLEDYPPVCQGFRELLEDRSMLVKKAEPLPVECIVRGYLAGSGYQEYRERGSVCGIRLNPGLREGEKLEEPLFTPATKSSSGHDENISLDRMMQMIGEELTLRIKTISLEIYRRAQQIAEDKGIIIADTKLEFGLLDNNLILIDELLTPDSSRFWPLDEYRPGRPQRSFDKQYVRDYLASLDWDRKPPAPALPPNVIDQTRQKYREALHRLTGQSL